jgi:hypothetical protein
VEPPLRLTELTYDAATGELVVPALPHDRAPESALAGYLEEARAIVAGANGADGDGAAPGLSDDFEHLRWFELPRACVS